MKSLLPIVLSVSLASCAGYRMGVDKPAPLAGVRTIAVPMMANNTQHPRVEALATSALASAIVADGTYRIAAAGEADAVLVATVKEIRYQAIRGRRLDTLRPEELTNTVTITWVLQDGRNPKTILFSGSSQGSSQLFADTDLQTARNNALPDALSRASVNVASTLANGF